MALAAVPDSSAPQCAHLEDGLEDPAAAARALPTAAGNSEPSLSFFPPSDPEIFRASRLHWGLEVEEGAEKHVLRQFCARLCPRHPVGAR